MTDVNPYRSPGSSQPPKGSLVPRGQLQTATALGEGLNLLSRNFAPIALVQVCVAWPAEVLKKLVLDGSAGVFGDVAVGLLVYAMVAPATLFAVVQGERQGRPVNVGDALRYGAERWAATLLVSLNVGLRVMLGMLLLVVPGLIWAADFALAPEMVALEGAANQRALDRSAKIASGNRGTILGICILAMLPTLVFGFAMGFVFGQKIPLGVVAVGDLFGGFVGAYGMAVGAVCYASLAFAADDADWIHRVRWAQGADTA